MSSDRTRAAVVGLAKAGQMADLTFSELPFVSREGDTAETQFLLAAAAADLWEEAGRGATPAPAAPEPCDDDGPAAPAGLASIAAAVCEECPALLRELCERLAKRGLSLPPRTLPAAFEAASGGGGARFSRVKRAVARAAGPRGRWLVRFNSDWAWVLEQAVDSVRGLEEGSAPVDFAEAFASDHFGTRSNALRRWRAADPAAARAALEDTWKGETAFRRASLLETFAEGLSPADEPFLDTALADRSKAVPAAAETLLLALPDSAFAAARRTAADALLTLEEGRTAKLVVRLPPSSGQQIEGDGGIDWGLLAQKPTPGTDRGMRAERLVQAIAGVSPHHWTERFERSPAELIALAEKAEHGGDVIAGWLVACIRFVATDPSVVRGWTPALSEWAADRLNRTRASKGEGVRSAELADLIPQLIASLSPADAAAFVRPLLETKAVAKAPQELGATLWNAVPDPWPDPFARTVVAVVEGASGRRGYEYHLWIGVLPGVLERLPPAVLADLPDGWPASHDPPSWLEKVSAAAHLRRRIHQLLP